MFATDDTIVAIATPPGRGGIGIVRLSGSDAPRIAALLTRRDGPFVPRHATFARVFAPSDDTPLDQVVVTWFDAPHSYTGDHVVEVSGHGSPVLLGRIVELSIAEGARLAAPGEFTFRAYLNGRLDLAQAEAVADLVSAVTPLQARAAPASALNRLDLPAFGRPTIATVLPSRMTRPARPSADNRASRSSIARSSAIATSRVTK